MQLSKAAELCYEITNSYLHINKESRIIASTQEAIRLTRQYLLNEIFVRWSPLNGEISFSYNGGKDCQVLLLLYLSCLWEYFFIKAQNSQFDFEFQSFPMQRLPTVFIDQEETFPTLENFVLETSERYCLSLYESQRQSGTSVNMADAFRDFIKIYPETEAIVIGIRHADPYGEMLKPIQRTDSNWPDFMRLQPLLHWDLTNIWSFLLYSNEPICGLYKEGFTSIGGIHNSLPNPHLKKDSNNVALRFEWEIAHAFGKDAKGEHDSFINSSPISVVDKERFSNYHGDYYPGWYLIDDTLERAGRINN
ncbi:Fad1p [Saccharomyces cerevisiae x Saccharomyces kudriavzevii VIN7]|uniref:FAD synthase n=1 Tax=Saccharomyces cerevisiae x Saccharomyces kudriavzevii (strain VIN7) TaxID=1095631 RepID=H0GSF8_SACCK|nr:Fad1p [Saccharomyces cerevisiae x Saccharomyces kudriavzevii VIN7]